MLKSFKPSFGKNPSYNQLRYINAYTSSLLHIFQPFLCLPLLLGLLHFACCLPGQHQRLDGLSHLPKRSGLYYCEAETEAKWPCFTCAANTELTTLTNSAVVNQLILQCQLHVWKDAAMQDWSAFVWHVWISGRNSSRLTRVIFIGCSGYGCVQ